jgi:hypothetical protein
VFGGPDAVADLGQALATIPPQAAAGFTTFCVKPSQFTDDPAAVGPLCREIMRRVDAMLPLAPGPGAPAAAPERRDRRA